MKIFDHEITTAAKARGEQRLISMVADLVVRDIVPGTPYQLIYGAVVEDMEKLRLALTERLGYGPQAHIRSALPSPPTQAPALWASPSTFRDFSPHPACGWGFFRFWKVSIENFARLCYTVGQKPRGQSRFG